MSDELIRLDDPQRCKKVTPSGQCEHRSLDGSDFCQIHGGALAARASERRQYLLDSVRHRERLQQFSEHSAVFSLKEEIGMSRLLIETRFNTLNDDEALVAAIPQLDKLMLTLSTLVDKAAKLEIQLGNVLTKDVVYALAQMFVTIVAEEVNQFPDHEEVVDRITSRIAEAVAQSKNPDR
jgi:hypothetical protein